MAPDSGSEEPSLGNEALAHRVFLGLIGFCGVCAPVFLFARIDLWTEMEPFERENKCRLVPQNITIRKKSLLFRGPLYSCGKLSAYIRAA